MSQVPQPPQVNYASQMMKPHRGTMILVLGILGLVVCLVCGIIAWVMANGDLREMDAGLMDPTGRETTKAGKICGIISVALTVVGCGAYIVLIAIMGATGALQEL